LARIVAIISRVAARYAGVIGSIEINPLIVYTAGEGAVAADALIVLTGVRG
jgi:succinyl-CoA synthetase beta subunit